MNLIAYLIPTLLSYAIISAANTNWNGYYKYSGLARSLPDECCQPGCGWSEACTRCSGISSPVCVRRDLLEISNAKACSYPIYDSSSSESSSSEEYGQYGKTWAYRRNSPPRPPISSMKRCRFDWQCKRIDRYERCISGFCRYGNNYRCFWTWT